MNVRSVRIALWSVIAVLMIFLAFTYYSARKGNEIEPVKLGVPFSLIDQNGAPITEAAFQGHPTALFFGFTHCPEVCPTTLFEMAGWLKALGDEGKDLRVFFISVDPERDTPEVMKGYTAAFTDRITGITGDPKEMEKVIKGWKIYARKVPTENGDYTMDHTASVMLLDRDARLKSTIDYKETTDVALKKLRLLLGS
ncbi:SCO family protein [Phyllobacterium sp. 22229]|uniref:SCO family protein n=1 Tax=Phyllobacterium myrsinacearum TaxID=28101 RepID=A0A2S9JAB1_9HYPH|nr:SCO family protein [Phyllobacterium myrsinacearum]PRD49712.1 SCO family protein [Phyllobacterium myrsinacearum]PWV94703.1 protein SCO1/2 [Phyllobacterium myrsinacearum]RZS87776.1 protein SCO1/2 [Phyllobacterium myrsinacearum]RZV07188.1 protein SCO1/2 [Phyllobacterium myrsinacearum]